MLHLSGNTVQERFLSAIRHLKIKFPGATIADKTGYKKATISEYLKKKAPSEAFIRTFSEKFDIDFDAIWEGKAIDKEEEKIIPPNIDQNFTASQLFAMFLKVSEAQTTILGDIKRGMAQEKTQAIIQKKIEAIETNLKNGLKNQNWVAGLAGEILERDVKREADGNQEKEKEILGKIAKKIGPDLPAFLKTGKRADGSR